MIKSIYNAMSGMLVQQKRQENVANNLANAQTPAFKVQEVMTSAKSEQEIVRNQRGAEAGIGTMPTGVEIQEIHTDYTQGLIESSDREMDYAIDGPGFFNITYGGTRAFTRDGGFSTNREGQLVTSQGYTLLGMNLRTGQNEAVSLSGDTFSIQPDGTVLDGGRETYRLMMSDFLDYGDLENLGDGVYLNAPADGLNREVMADDFTLVAGANELANVDVLDEMVKMIEISRAYESNQRVVQAIDEMMDKAANSIGKI